MDEIIRDNHIISAKNLAKNIGRKNIKILDVRWSLDKNIKSWKSYLYSHLPNAIFFDLEFFSDSNSELPHMLPNEAFFKEEISKLGVKNKDKIIIYDQNGFFSSCRVWFMFKLFGHKDVLILDGGLNNWIKNKMATTDKITEFKPSNFKTKLNNKKILTKLEIKKSLNNDNYTIVDARPENRFLGIEKEPREGLMQGNIETSINIPFNSICDSNGLLFNSDDLRNLFFAVASVH